MQHSNKKPIHVAIYARVSTNDKGQDVQIQLDRCKKFCEAMDWTFKEYTDKESAYRKKGEDRPKFMEMMEAIRTHEVQGVVIYQMDRFSREDPMKVSTYLNQIVHDHKGIFVSIADGVDSRNEVFPVIERIMSWQANNWSKAHGQRVKAGIAKERKKKEDKGLDTSWGRKPRWKERGEPELVAKALKLREQGLSWGEMGKKLGVGRSTAKRMYQIALEESKGVIGTGKQDSTVRNPDSSTGKAPGCTDKTSIRNTEGGE